MTVYIVMVEGWDEDVFAGVFSTREKAEKYINTLDDSDRDFAEITPYEVV